MIARGGARAHRPQLVPTLFLKERPSRPFWLARVRRCEWQALQTRRVDLSMLQLDCCVIKRLFNSGEISAIGSKAPFDPATAPELGCFAGGEVCAGAAAVAFGGASSHFIGFGSTPFTLPLTPLQSLVGLGDFTPCLLATAASFGPAGVSFWHERSTYTHGPCDATVGRNRAVGL